MVTMSLLRNIKYLATASAVASELVAWPVSADFTVKEYEVLVHNDEFGRIIVRHYLNGLVEGYIGMDEEYKRQGLAGRICVPSHRTLYTDDFVHMIDDFIEEDKQFAKGLNSISFIMLFVLERSFPCEGKQGP
jgi:hypothetical protein